ncbi:hypothetical protein ACFL1Z_06015 [Thermodesulfobacteriota bacterium]
MKKRKSQEKSFLLTIVRTIPLEKRRDALLEKQRNRAIEFGFLILDGFIIVVSTM